MQVGVRSNTQVHHYGDEPGIVGAAIYGEIFIDQRSLRSHPNKAVDVVVCQTSWNPNTLRQHEANVKSTGGCGSSFSV